MQSHQLARQCLLCFQSKKTLCKVADCEVDSVLRRTVSEQHASCSFAFPLGSETVPHASNRSTCTSRKRFFQQTKLLVWFDLLSVPSISSISFPRPRSTYTLEQLLQLFMLALHITYRGVTAKSRNSGANKRDTLLLRLTEYRPRSRGFSPLTD